MNLNSGQPWSEGDLWDLRNSLAHGSSADEVADFLCRDPDEVRQKMAQLGLEERPECGGHTSSRAQKSPVRCPPKRGFKSTEAEVGGKRASAWKPTF
jgi:hypothetical protein